MFTVQSDNFGKLDLEIAVYQQIRANNQTFEGVPDHERHAHILTQTWGWLCPFLAQNNPNMATTKFLFALFVATGLLSSYKMFHWH